MNLIIQGPILSIGRGGKSAWLSKEQIEKEDIIQFNCENSIIKILIEYSRIFEKIIIVTWFNEIISESFIKRITEFPNVTLKRIPETNLTETKKFQYREDLKNSAIASNNKLKQFYLVYKALEEEVGLQSFWLKIRTDQSLNLSLIPKSDIVEGKVYVPKLFPRGFHDFYFVGTLKTLRDYSYNYVFKHKELAENLHIDFSLNLAYNNHILYRLLLMMVQHLKTSKSEWLNLFSKAIELFIRHRIDKIYFVELPSDIRKTIVWRGQKLKGF